MFLIRNLVSQNRKTKKREKGKGATMHLWKWDGPLVFSDACPAIVARYLQVDTTDGLGFNGHLALENRAHGGQITHHRFHAVVRGASWEVTARDGANGETTFNPDRKVDGAIKTFVASQMRNFRLDEAAKKLAPRHALAPAPASTIEIRRAKPADHVRVFLDFVERVDGNVAVVLKFPDATWRSLVLCRGGAVDTILAKLSAAERGLRDIAAAIQKARQEIQTARDRSS
jgi:hypothetical protein